MPRPKGGKTRVEEEGAEHISTQDVEDAQLRATLAATHVDELRAQVADCSRRQRAKRPRDVVGGDDQWRSTFQFKNLGGQYRIRTYILVLSMES